MCYVFVAHSESCLPDWIWGPEKDKANRKKHGGLSLADGVLVLQDPLALSIADPHPDGDRWRTIGSAAGVVILFVVHTQPVAQIGGEPVGRIISVRKAEKRERRAYETRRR